MAPRRIPGPQGTRGGNTSPDFGTLARTIAYAPGVSLSIAGDTSTKEAKSSSIDIKRAYAYKISDGMVVGEVFFATDDDKVYADDEIQLVPLVKSLKKRIEEGFEIGLLCTGKADYRARVWYNYRLGLRRAHAVMNFIRKAVSEPSLKLKVDSIGELKALQPIKGKRPSLANIMKDRKVSIAIDKGGLLPPVTIAWEGDLIYYKPLEEAEINSGGRVVTNSREQHDPKAERDYAGKEHDALKALVQIRVKYSEKSVAGKKQRYLKCDAVNASNGRILFSAQTKVSTKLSVDIDYTPMYYQLKGRYLNITERVKVRLGRKTGSV